MLDINNLAPTTQQIFTANLAQWQTWLKPKTASFVQFFMLSGGGGGGGAAAIESGNGGGGGGSSAQSSFIFPAWAIPDVLYILVGTGGRGGNVSPIVVASAGTDSYVSVAPSTTVNYILCRTIGGGAGSSGGTGGGGGGATTIANSPLAALGFPAWGHAATNITLSGQSGSTSPAEGAGNGPTLITTGLRVTGGSGGGGNPRNGEVGFNGGNISTPAGGVYPTQSGGLAGAGTNDNGGNGSNGFQAIPKLLQFYGGTGGASSGRSGTATTGGNGGAGSFGCGGGGGGGGFVTGGSGGDGGPGIVIATWW
jgi:hypothetical protein